MYYAIYGTMRITGELIEVLSEFAEMSTSYCNRAVKIRNYYAPKEKENYIVFEILIYVCVYV